MIEYITPIILAGGAGKRLRPLTNSRKPKAFVKMTRNYNLLQETLIRSAGMSKPIIVTHMHFLDHTRKSLESLMQYGIEPRAIIAEPYRRSTAPAIASAALAMAPHQPFVVMPCDHMVGDERALMEAILAATKHVHRHGGIVSIGVKPRSASSRFGYIHKGEPVQDVEHQSQPVYHSGEFIEKPFSNAARSYFKSGEYLWNTGIFIARVYDYLQAYQKIDNSYLELTKQAFEQSRQLTIGYDFKTYVPERDYYHKLPQIPVDTSVLQCAPQRYVIEYDGFWDDVGTVPSFFKLRAMRFCGMIKE